MSKFDIDKRPVYDSKAEKELKAIQDDYRTKKEAAQAPYRAMVGASKKDQDAYFYEIVRPIMKDLAEKRAGESRLITDNKTPIGTRGM